MIPLIPRSTPTPTPTHTPLTHCSNLVERLVEAQSELFKHLFDGLAQFVQIFRIPPGQNANDTVTPDLSSFCVKTKLAFLMFPLTACQLLDDENFLWDIYVLGQTQVSFCSSATGRSNIWIGSLSGFWACLGYWVFSEASPRRTFFFFKSTRSLKLELLEWWRFSENSAWLFVCVQERQFFGLPLQFDVLFCVQHFLHDFIFWSNNR